MPDVTVDPLRLLRPRRKPVGMSAILLPFDETGAVDWPGFGEAPRPQVDWNGRRL